MSVNLKSLTNLSAGLSQGNVDRAQILAWVSRFGPPTVATLAVIGIAWQAAQLTWMAFSPSVPAPTTQNAATTTASGQPNQANNATLNPQGIADAHLFGTPGATNTGLADPNKLPENKSLVLTGTMATNDPEVGFAIVGQSATNAKFYKVGATITGGTKLHSVYTDRVIIDRNGALETLILPRDAPSTAVVSASATTNSQIANNLQRLANSSPETLGNLLRAQPVFANGVLKGYRVYPGRDRRQFTKLGLQPGDLVTAINGNTLDDPSRGAEILSTLTSSANALVAVERDGVLQTISLDLAALSIPDDTSSTAATEDNADNTSGEATEDAATPSRGNGSGPLGASPSARQRSGNGRNRGGNPGGNTGGDSQ